MRTMKLERAILLALKMNGDEAVERDELITMAQRLFPGKNVIDCTLVGDAIRELERRGLVKSGCDSMFFVLTPEGYRAATVNLMGVCWHRCDLLAERGVAELRREAAGERKPVAAAVRLLEAGGSLCRAIIYVSAAAICAHVAMEVICRAW